MRYRGARYQGARYRGKRQHSLLILIAGLLSVVLVSVLIVGAVFQRWTEEKPAAPSEPEPEQSSAAQPVQLPEKPDITPDTPPSPEPEPEVIIENTGGFELPLEGTHGITLVDAAVYSSDQTGDRAGSTLPAGTAFTILQEGERRLLVCLSGGNLGWIDKNYIMVNLPDLIPSILYRDSNAEGSLMKNLGMDLKGITDKKLYECKVYNAKLDREEYIMPVQYHMAKKLMYAQQLAREKNLTIVLYEGFRPHDVQMAIADALQQLARNNTDTKLSIQKNGFNISYYINTGISSHQMGSAVDVSLASVDRWEEHSFHGNKVLVPGSYTEFSYSEIRSDNPNGIQFSTSQRYGPDLPEDTYTWMPTPIHELSYLSGTFTGPTKTYTAGAWKSALKNKTVQLAEFWTGGAQTLQDLFVEADMEPLASEWWHFNDLDAWNTAKKANAGGNFEVGTQSFSMKPADAVDLANQ